MDKTFQDIKIVVDDPRRKITEEKCICSFRAVRLMEILKRPSYLILRFSTENPAINEVIIPILPYMQLIIE